MINIFKPFAFIKEEAFSHRIPPAQNIATFLFLSISEDSRPQANQETLKFVVSGCIDFAKVPIENSYVPVSKTKTSS